MAPLDLSGWLEPVEESAPTGPNLEFDPVFGELERTAQGEPERQAGNSIIPAKDPDWKEVETLADALTQRTRDLRVLGYLGVARLHTGGLAAYAETLDAIRQLLDTRWADVHPKLDPEDDNDPTMRVSALLRLAHPGLVLRHLRDMPLARSPRLGRLSWRDIAAALGEIKEEPRQPQLTETDVRAAFQDTPPEFPAALRAAAIAAAAAAAGIPPVFDSHAGTGSGPDFSDLLRLLSQITRYIERFAVTTDSAAVSAEEEAPTGTDETVTPVARRGGGISSAHLTEVTNRAEALRLLELVCAYYRRHEPSSPLPMLIERAQRLAEKNFLEILRDLAPDGLVQAQMIVGQRDE